MSLENNEHSQDQTASSLADTKDLQTPSLGQDSSYNTNDDLSDLQALTSELETRALEGADASLTQYLQEQDHEQVALTSVAKPGQEKATKQSASSLSSRFVEARIADDSATINQGLSSIEALAQNPQPPSESIKVDLLYEEEQPQLKLYDEHGQKLVANSETETSPVAKASDAEVSSTSSEPSSSADKTDKKADASSKENKEDKKGGAEIFHGATISQEGTTAIMGLDKRGPLIPATNHHTKIMSNMSAQDLEVLNQINALNAKTNKTRQHANAELAKDIAERYQKDEVVYYSSLAFDTINSQQAEANGANENIDSKDSKAAARERLAHALYSDRKFDEEEAAQNPHVSDPNTLAVLTPPSSGSGLKRLNNESYSERQASTMIYGKTQHSIQTEPVQSNTTIITGQPVMGFGEEVIESNVSDPFADAPRYIRPEEFKESSLESFEQAQASVMAHVKPETLATPEQGNANDASAPMYRMHNQYQAEENVDTQANAGEEDSPYVTPGARRKRLENDVTNSGASPYRTHRQMQEQAQLQEQAQAQAQAQVQQSPIFPQQVMPTSEMDYNPLTNSQVVGQNLLANNQVTAPNNYIAPNAGAGAGTNDFMYPYYNEGTNLDLNLASGNTQDLALKQSIEPEAEAEADAPMYVVGPKFKTNDTQANANASESAAPIYPGVYANLKRQKGEIPTPAPVPPLAPMASDTHESVESDTNVVRALATETIDTEAEVNSVARGEMPAGMEDGAFSDITKLAQQSAPVVSELQEEDDGPHYMVGTSMKKRERNARLNDANDTPIYAVGPKPANAKVQAKTAELQAKLQAEYTDSAANIAASVSEDADLSPESLSSREANDQAYESALAEAARESIAAPDSEVVKRARLMVEASRNQEPVPSTETETSDEFGAFLAEAAYQEAQNNGGDESPANTGNYGNKAANATYNIQNMPSKEHVNTTMVVYLYLRQLLASFFTHTTLPIFAPHMAMRLGPCCPSSMAIPFFFVGLISGAIGATLEAVVEFKAVGAASFLVFLLLTGLTAYRGIYKLCTYMTRRRHDAVLLSASVTVPMFIFIYLLTILYEQTSGITEATLAIAFASMLSAATASSLTWNMPQDPLDSSGIMTTRGLLFVIVLCFMAAFGLLNYIVGLSVLSLSFAMRLIFGYCMSRNQGTAHRSYVYALQLLTLFAIFIDLILLKSHGYELLSSSTLDFVNLLRHYSARF